MWYTLTPGTVYGSCPLVFVLAFPEEFGSIMSTDGLTYECKFGYALKKLHGFSLRANYADRETDARR
jgi:hypothetical protein